MPNDYKLRFLEHFFLKKKGCSQSKRKFLIDFPIKHIYDVILGYFLYMGNKFDEYRYKVVHSAVL